MDASSKSNESNNNSNETRKDKINEENKEIKKKTIMKITWKERCKWRVRKEN